MKRLYLVILVSLVMSAGAFAQGGVLSGQVLKCGSSVVASGATIYVGTEASTGNPPAPLASIYSDSTLVTPLANPTTADSCGNFPTIYAAQGNYRVCMSGTGLTARCVAMNVSANGHAILSATHTDTTAASAVRGDFLAAVGATPKWTAVHHGAAVGSYPKWNGTDVVASTLGASGTGDCQGGGVGTNQFVSAVNADAVPTCATPGTEDVSAGLKTWTRSITLFDPVAGDSGRIQFVLPKNVTITRVWCNVKAATNAVIQLNKRAEGSPDVAGTDVLTGALTCITTGANTTSFASAAVTSRTPIALTISSVTGTPDTLRVHVEGTIDDSQ